jgi:hypothetical protein
MKIYRVLSLALLFVILAASCQDTKNSCQKAAEDAPAAMTPSGINVFAVLQKGGGWVNVGISGNGDYEVLPGGLPSGGMRFYFYAPWPGTLKITLDGVPIPLFADVPAGTSPATTGYYKILNINPNPKPPIWTIGIRPPDSKLRKTSYDVTIASVSVNPKYAAGTPEKESAPLTVKLAAQKVFTITVFKTGTGRGTVTSNPPGITCGIDCIFDFSGNMALPVQLQAVSASSTFRGWTSSFGSCNGTGICTVPSTGMAATVSAEFEDNGGGGGMQGCPGPKSFDGFTFIGNPACASNDIAGHPDADLACDAQGYFCCEGAQGANEPRCGGIDKRQFPADCMDYGPKASFKEFLGCYIAD